MLHSVNFRKEDVCVNVPAGANLRQACLDSGIDPYPVLGGLLSCRGKGFCGTCLVGVSDTAALSPPSAREAKYLRKHPTGAVGAALPEGVQGYRLSCQALVQGDLTVTTDPDTGPAWRSHPFYSGRPAHSWEQAS
ncbi:MAG: 2Fe-2S iron-sulfur cluster-binding protein [Planctomycetota bacterium]